MYRKKYVLLIILLILGISNAQSSIADSRESALKKFADKAMTKIQIGNFENLLMHFYYPPHYSDMDRENDREALVAGLKELFGNDLGALDDFSRTKSIDQRVFSLSLATGTAQTSLESASGLIYKTVFHDFGKGYVIIGIHEGNKELLIKYIAVALPVSNPKSMKVGRKFAHFMMDIARKQQTENSPQSGKPGISM